MLKVRYIYVSRVGLQGSSGNHGDRRFPRETIIMNAVADGLKARLGIDDLALAGQSGGSTIAVSLVTMGRKDVKCAVSGSGALGLVDQQYEAATRLGVNVVKAAVAANVYDPATHVGDIVPRADRRIFVLGDPLDTDVLYKFQAPFVDRAKGAGHHALAIAVEGLGPDHHDVIPATLPVAGACLNNDSDERIVRRAVELSHAQIRGQAQALALANGRGAAPIH
jgi:pimeloyl-ACP methyl ester carboxylesterase